MFLGRLGLRLLRGWRRSMLPVLAAALAGLAATLGLLAAIAADQVVKQQIERLIAREPVLGASTGPIVMHWSDRYSFGTVERFLVSDENLTDFAVPPGLERLPRAGEVMVSNGLGQLLETNETARLGLPGTVVGEVARDGLRQPDELVAWIGVSPGAMQGPRASGFGSSDRLPEVILGGFRIFYWVAGALLLGVPVVVTIALATRAANDHRRRQLFALRAIGASPVRLGLALGIGIGAAASIGSVCGAAAFPHLLRLVSSSGPSWMSFFIADAELTLITYAFAVAALTTLVVVTSLVSAARALRDPIPARPRLAINMTNGNRLWFLAGGVATMAIVGAPIALAPLLALMLTFIGVALIAVGLAAGTSELVALLAARLSRKRLGPVGLMTARRLQFSSLSSSRSAAALGTGLFMFCLLGPAEVVLGGDPTFERQVIMEQEADGRSLLQVEVPEGMSLERLHGSSSVQAVMPIARSYDPSTGAELGDAVLIADCDQLHRIALSPSFECPEGPFQIAAPAFGDTENQVTARDPAGQQIDINSAESPVDLGLPDDENLGGLIVLSPSELERLTPNGLVHRRYLIMIDPGAAARDDLRARVAGLVPSALITDAVDYNVGGSQRLLPLLTFLRVVLGTGLAFIILASSLAASEGLTERADALAALRQAGVPLRLLKRVQYWSVLLPGLVGVSAGAVGALIVSLAFRNRLGISVMAGSGMLVAACFLTGIAWALWSMVGTTGLGQRLNRI